jgi:hypothetical protein
MSSRERENAMSDAALEREIEQALSVEPSPEFLPRVRAAIPSDGGLRPWKMRWVWLGALSTAVAIVAVFLMTNRSVMPEPRRLPDPPKVSVAAPEVPILVPEAPNPPVREVTRRKPVLHTSNGASKLSTGPEVLISKSESAALKRLMRGLREGRVEPATFDSSGIRAAEPPKAIVVPPISAILPIAIEPLDFEGGVRR